MQATSIRSYHKLTPSKTAAERQKILDVFQKYPTIAFSDRSLSKLTGLAINIVESRRNDLDKKYGKIEFSREERDPLTHRDVRKFKLKRTQP